MTVQSTVDYINMRPMRLEGETTGPRHLVIEGVTPENKMAVVNFLTDIGARIVDFPVQNSVRANGLSDSQLRAVAEAGIRYPGTAGYQSNAAGAYR